MRTSFIVFLSLFIGVAHAADIPRVARGNTGAFGRRGLYGTNTVTQNKVANVLPETSAQNTAVEIDVPTNTQTPIVEEMISIKPDTEQPGASDSAPVETASDKLNAAIENVRVTCGGLSSELSDLRVMAGVGTAVSAVGTVAGGAALGTGITKAKADDAAMKLTPWAEEWNKLIKADTNTGFATVTYREKSKFDKYFDDLSANEKKAKSIGRFSESDMQEYRQGTEEGKRGKTMGNIRTGTLAASTATNIAGAVLSGTNRIGSDFREQINACLSSVRILSDIRMQARIDGTVSDIELSNAENIIRACEEWATVDISSINKRGLGAAITSGIGAGMGAAGTVTGAIANTDKNHLSGSASEHKLNMASNVLAGGTAAASLTSSILNGAQIKAIKRAATVADACDGALK